jgi:cytochrome P450 / NADPH-cytochrome P450 reductase
LAEAAKDEATKSSLQKLAGDTYSESVIAKRISILHLLEQYPSVALPLESFLSLLPPMRVRQYSISSSPLRDPCRASLTFSLLSAPSLSGQGTHEGVASSYLASLGPGDRLHVASRPSHAAFHLPADPERVPVICIGAGSGIAPFRGFVQERAAMLGAGRALAPALLFFGCRDPTADDLYREEMDRFEQLGAVSVRRAYSRRPEAADGCRHVQDRLWRDRAEVAALWERGAKVFVCGSREVGEGVKQTILEIRKEWAVKKGLESEDKKMLEWFESIRNERYATDVFD